MKQKCTECFDSFNEAELTEVSKGVFFCPECVEHNQATGQKTN